MPASDIAEWGGQEAIGSGGMMPAITAMKNGSYLAAWIEGSTIKARTIGADHQTKSDVFTIASGTALKNPCVTELTDGGIVVTWEEASTASAYAAIFNVKADGTTETRKAPFKLEIPQAPFSNHGNTSVTALTGGGFAVSATDSFGTTPQSSATTYVYDSSGTLIRAHSLAASYTTKDTAVTALHGSNAYVTVASAANESNNYELKAEIYSASGSKIAAIAISSGNAAAPSFAVETLADGRFVIVWTQSNTVRARFFKADGTVDGNVELYSAASVHISNISVKATKDGFALAFQQDETLAGSVDSDVFLATYSLTGELRGTPRMVHPIDSGGFEEFSALTTLADGRIVVNWKGPGGVIGGIQSRIFDDRREGVNLEHKGTAGNDVFFGTNWNDTLAGGSGNDILNGGDGNDFFITSDVPDAHGDNAADMFNGNGGSADKVVYWDAGAIIIDLMDQTKNGGAAKGDILNDIDIIDGSRGADRIEGDNRNNAFWGNDGNDTLKGGRGDDEVKGGDGNDVLVGGEGNDLFWGEDDDDFLDASHGGNDIFQGGSGKDTVSYWHASDKIQLYMHGKQTSTGAAAGDTFFTDIEVIDGTTFADTIEGTIGDQAFWGASGADVLKGYENNDVLKGGSGSDTLHGGTGADTLDGAAETDPDTGFDWASYSEAVEAVSVSLVSGRGTAGEAAGDTLIRIEGLIGSRMNDTLSGAAHELRGGLGNDIYHVGAATKVTEDKGGGRDTVYTGVSFTLSSTQEIEVLTATGSANVNLKGNSIANTITGNAKVNKLYGGSGNDQLKGGAGKDYFVFNTKANARTNKDKITDFSVKDDTIWLDNAVFTKLGKSGSEKAPAKLNKSFFVLGSKAKDKNDYVIYDKTKGVLFYDADGLGSKYKQVEITTLYKNLKMTPADFFVI